VIHPTPRAIVLALAGFPLALLPGLVHPRAWGPWVVLLALTLLAVGIDAILALPPAGLAVAVVTPETLAVGQEGRLGVRLRAARRGAAAVEVRCELDPRFLPPPSRQARMGPTGEGELAFPLVARRRGELTVDEIWCRWTGPLGLVGRQKRVPAARRVAVVPDLRPVQAAAFRYFGARELEAGIQVERFVGDGSELDALREYVPGLDPRAIDWKASARHRKLVSREFRAERNHQVILAMDTGHLMAEPLHGVARLDHAVSAALLLGYVSLRIGDRVGLYGFDAAPRAWAAPQGGLAAFRRLQAASAALDYSTAETNFTLGLAELSTRLRRRSLVVVFTEFVDSVTAELMVDNLARLARRQLVVFVALRDPALEGVALARPRRLGDVYRSVVSADLVLERERVLARLRRAGVLCVDAAPGSVSASLVNRYLEVKRREMV
jgi:uncharacterized protein (DUF58 family)